VLKGCTQIVDPGPSFQMAQTDTSTDNKGRLKPAAREPKNRQIQQKTGKTVTNRTVFALCTTTTHYTPRSC